ncbi:deleted in malignant brain tumors 1 protein-like [Salarias fasciatus]|uniref:deleted in malignant brain tumors 1 protein-like n=1 Tax=Salarias fasciatus TaxID=181472 RepID=UPI001176E562|nr:deleted in malignant brain tumors 1 protein-like [Salarias fasciatus]
MNIVIERSYLNSLGYSSHDLYLNDEHCRPKITSYQVIFSFPIESCGNVKQISSDRVVYTNGLRSSNSSSGEITRHAVLKLNVTCIMDQDSLSENMFVIQNPGNSAIIGTGKFNTTMTFYTSSSFYYPVTEFPYEVELNEYIYVQIDLKSSDNSLVIFLDTCVASPSPHDFQTRAYYFVRNGCTADNTYYAYYSGSRDYARFRVKTFQFLRASESVYLQCKVLVCQASDYNSRCRRGCTRRRARDLGSGHDSQTLVLGPIKLKAWKEINTYPHQKPCLNKKVWFLLKACNTTFRSGDAEACSTSRANLRRGIINAKLCNKLEVEECFCNPEPRCMWQGIQVISDDKPSNSTPLNTDVSFLNELTDFYAHFVRDNMKTSTTTRPPADYQPLSLNSTDTALISVSILL